jgi:hypothetical protein
MTIGWVMERWWSRGSDDCGSGVRFQKQRWELCEVGPKLLRSSDSSTCSKLLDCPADILGYIQIWSNLELGYILGWADIMR